MKKHWCEELPREACREAVEWAITQPTLKQAWGDCKRGDWMLWLLGHRHRGANRKRLVLCVCAITQFLSEYLPIGKEYLRMVAKTTEAEAKGQMTTAEVQRVVSMVNGAHSATETAYRASITAYDYDRTPTAGRALQRAATAAEAIYTAWVIIHAVTHPSFANSIASCITNVTRGREAALAQCADIVREYFPAAPERRAK